MAGENISKAGQTVAYYIAGKDNPVSGQTLGEVWKFGIFYLYLVLFNIRTIMEKKPEARTMVSVYFLQ